MSIEYELKFRASSALLQAIAEDFPGEKQTFTMATTYYDTPSGALAAKKFMLRCRMENNVSVCTLKTPAGKKGRNETELVCDSIETAIAYFCSHGAPLEFADMVQEGLSPICGAQFHRIAIPVSYGDCRLELALDQGCLYGDGSQAPLCEVEVELKSGSTEAADLFALELANRYGLTAETKSKFRRALDLVSSKGE